MPTTTQNLSPLAISDQAALRSVLSQLLDACASREFAYVSAADAVRASPVQNVFLAYARQRALFSRDLVRTITRLGGGTARVEAAPTSGIVSTNLTLIVDTLDRSENDLANAYAEALCRIGDRDISVMLTRHLSAIASARDSVRTLRKLP
jgi:hypothetical protein